MQYEDRLVAFIDILAFRAMVNDTVDGRGNEDGTKIRAVYDAFKLIESNWRNSSESPSKQVTIFSDSIVISVEANERRQLSDTLSEIRLLIMSLIKRGILIRGAVVRGRLIHEPGIVFGPALIEAYVLESKAALYPRIILDRDLISIVENSGKISSFKDSVGYINSLLGKDSDGMYHIDYFHTASQEWNNPEFDLPSYIDTLGDIIRRGLMGSVHPNNADVKVKYYWMRERYNQMVDTMRVGIGQSTDMTGEENREKLWSLHNHLKKISPNRS